MCRHFHLLKTKNVSHLKIYFKIYGKWIALDHFKECVNACPLPKICLKKYQTWQLRLYDLWPIMISKMEYELMYEIFIYFVNVVYLNKCAHTIKSLNLTDSVQNVWQKILIAPSPSSSQMFTLLRDVWILDIILIFLMFEFQLFFTLWIERGSFN